ncbi:tail assembly protein [Mixta mediterraneensis]|uniref:tail assembly protein n=1 Tax=Mixta mediterraneensis TaxID=2758443 RepID=UPI0018773659|nr:tail assembly protein [Mixta mediterraneensis]MBE5251720.1 tail assembly protein [Mixta mediterraneensis]
MESTLRTIRLYGVLGATFGRVHHMAVETPREAIRALCVVIPGFERFLNTSRKRGLTYAVFSGRQNLAVEELEADHSKSEIRIAPVIMGSKRAGALQTILGAVLVVVGVAIGYFTGGTLSTMGYGVAKFGAAMMLGGVVQMLSPQTPGIASKQDADNQASYAFGSPTNTAAQGYPVPLLYGQRRIGGAIISAGIYVEDQQ